MMVLKKILTSNITLFVLSAVAVVTLNWHILLASLYSLIPMGNDSVGHYEVGLYYAQHIFPKTWGWIPELFGGMPFPQYYPPLFYFITALLYRYSPFSYVHIFNAVLFVLTISIPGLTGLIARKQSHHSCGGWCAASLSVLLMTLFYDPFGNLGISIQGTYTVGLVPQLLGFVCLLGWLYFFLDLEKSRLSWSFSILFLTLTFLSNAHIVPTACIIFATIAIYRWIVSKDKKKIFSLYFSAGIFSTLAVSFWYMPMLATFTYLSGRSLGYDTGFIPLFFKGLVMFTLVIVAMIIARKKRDHPFVGFTLALTIIGILVFSHIDSVIPRLPVHSLRSLAPLYFLAPIAADYALTQVLITMKGVKVFYIGGFFIVIMLISLVPYAFFVTNSYSFTQNEYSQLHIDDILKYMSDKEGMVNVEVTDGGRILNSYLSALSSKNPKLVSDYSVIAESSISSFFMIPTRGAVSERYEIMPVDSHLSSYRQLALQKKDPTDVTHSIEQAQALGVNYFFAKSKAKIDMLKQSKKVTLDKDFGAWKLFKTVEPSERVEVLPYEPILLFSTINFKKRNAHDYDYVEFQEQAYIRSLFDMTFVYSHDQNLDTSDDINLFSTLVVSNYSYKNIDRAEKRLVEYSKSHTLILIASDDPLFQRLKNDVPNNIQVFYLPEHVQALDNTYVEQGFDDMFAYLMNHRISINNASKVHITSSSFVGNSISVTLDNPIHKKVPILIKSSYYPTWIDTVHGVHPYLATPTFMIIYVDDTVNLVLKPHISIYIGTFFSLLGLIGWYIYYRRLS